jgi:hypothetical protein
VVSWGLGVDSSAYLTEILDNPDRYRLDLDRLIVVHAVVGSEWATSLAYAHIGNPGYQNVPSWAGRA